MARELEDIATQVDPNSPLIATPLSDAFIGELLPFKYGAGTATVVGVSGLLLAVVGLSRDSLICRPTASTRPGSSLGDGRHAARRARTQVRRELRFVVIGLAAGLVGAAVISKVLATIVLSLTPMGAGGFIMLATALFVVAMIATVIPAAGALRIAPMQLLRQD